MPPTTQSPAGSRHNVTAVIQRHEALTIDVCRAGDRVAIHANTRFGIVVITMAELEFVAKARGPIAYNNVPFRSLEQIRELAGENTPPPPARPPKADTEDASTRCEAAWAYAQQYLHVPANDVALAHGLVPSTFKVWLSRHHPRELTRLRREAGLTVRPTSTGEPIPVVKLPVFKPGGKIL